MMLPVVFGFSGPVLTDAERALFREADPSGYILFSRNIEDPAQLLRLTDSLRTLAGWDVPILIDQEGGRVARLRPPHWPAFPPAARFGELYAVRPDDALEACRLNGLALAATLRSVGVTVDCLPCLDVAHPDTHAVIGDRSYGAAPSVVAALGAATLEGLQAGGVLGVIKHLPGHGRARADSHEELPTVDATFDELQADFAPFRHLGHQAAMGMTAHIVYSAIDPGACASHSPTVIQTIIRQHIGFDGWLFSDDICMHALAGPMTDRAAFALTAGCDAVLHCSGMLAEMEEIVSALPSIEKSKEGYYRRMVSTMASDVTEGAQRLLEQRDSLLNWT